MDSLTIRQTTPDDPGTAALIDAHFQLMRSQSPEESCHVLPAEGLHGLYMLAAELDGQVVGIGAIAEVEPGHAEIKSMHTAQKVRGVGIARTLLRGLIDEALRIGQTRASLETGSAAEFSAARRLYASEGFEYCDPFGDYVKDPLSVFMTRAI